MLHAKIISLPKMMYLLLLLLLYFIYEQENTFFIFCRRLCRRVRVYIKVSFNVISDDKKGVTLRGIPLLKCEEYIIG